MNPVKTFFKDLTLFSRVGPVDATYEGVTPVRMARLSSHARAAQPNPVSLTLESCQCIWRDYFISPTQPSPVSLTRLKRVRSWKKVLAGFIS
jgi:hypothetical protein